MTEFVDAEPLYKCPESSELRRDRNLNSQLADDGFLYFAEDTCHELAGQVCRASCNYPFLFSWHYDLMNHVAADFGFAPFSYTRATVDDLQIITTTNRGILKSESNTVLIWHFALPNGIAPPVIVSSYERALPITHVYRGEKFLLVRASENAFAYPIDQYEEIEQFLKSLDYYIHTPVQRIAVDLESRILTLDAHWLRVAVSGMQGDSFEEEERVRLSKKLADSQPFFDYKAPIQVNWDLLKAPQDESFEELCLQLLSKEASIVRVIPIGRTRAADRGRDFEAHEKTGGFLESKTLRWLVQCKFSDKSISPRTISGWTDRVREHGYDGFWLMTNNYITPDLYDQFEGVRGNTDIQVRFWQRSDFQIKLNVYSELLKGLEFFKG